MKYYAVAKGKEIGIFNNWDKTKSLVNGFSGAKYKSFKTLDDAQQYIKKHTGEIPSYVENPIYDSNFDSDANVQKNNNLDSFGDDSDIIRSNYKKNYGKNYKSCEEKSLLYMYVDNQVSEYMEKAENNYYKIQGISDKIIIYTDGSCIDKIGGYGFVLIDENNVAPFSGPIDNEYNNRLYSKNQNRYTYQSTNQVAELYAIYQAILFAKEVYSEKILNGIVLYTDSKYSIGCLNTWSKKWKLNGWVNAKGQNVKNRKLIEVILEISIGLNIKYLHVKAHNGDTYNEMADKLANIGRMESVENN